MSTDQTSQAEQATAPDRAADDATGDGDADHEDDAGGREESARRVEKAIRGRRWPDVDREVWEVFRRDGDDGPLTYVGRVRAADADEAHEVASRLYAWYAPEVWVCPAASVARFSTDVDPVDAPDRGDEPRTIEF